MEESGIQSGSTGSARVEPPARINNVFLDELITLNMKLFLSSLPTLTVSLFVSFRPVYTGRGTVGLLLTKKTQNKKNDKKKTNHKSHPRNFTSLQKPFFRALCLAAAPPPFVSAGRTLVTAHVFFLFFHCGFFFFLSSWRGKVTLPHHQLELCFCTLLVCRRHGNNDKTAASVSPPTPQHKELELERTTLNYGGTTVDGF